ncbi:MAG: hypothetical protein IPQ07_24875 [Myxococcales bacterium]|nr:hypothetical protein [Myxococcales bacterium]
MTSSRRTISPPSPPSPGSYLVAAVAAGALLGLVGCATDPSDLEDPDLASARSEGPLAAAPGIAALGRFRVGTSGELAVQLDNSGRTDIVIRQVSLVPPDPYVPGYVPPDPCLPPDPYTTSVPPDPYHNPPAFLPPESYLTTRLIAPCVKPGDSTTLSLGFLARDAGGFAAGVRIAYATADGAAFTLTVPASACAVAR